MSIGFLAVIMLLLAIVGAVTFINGLYNSHRVSKMPVVFGTVIGKVVGEEIRYPTYRYEWGGVYENKSVLANTQKRRVPVGSVHEIRVDPANPEKIYEKGCYTPIIICGLMLFLTFGASLLIN